MQEDKDLEELVLAVDMEKLHVVFREFVRVQQAKRRCTLKRLAVHLLCEDGLVRVPRDIEQAILAGWFTVASSLLSEGGYVSFSITLTQQIETAILQFPWVFPQWFCFDCRDYTTAKLAEGGIANRGRPPRLPRSTPLGYGLPYAEVPRGKPSGTLAVNLDWVGTLAQVGVPGVRTRQSVRK